MKSPFRGLGVALITPFKADGSVDMATLSVVTNRLLEGGVDFLCVLGTTAETPCLTDEEKAAICRHVIREVAGRVPVLLGCGGNNTQAVVHYLRTADLTGVSGVLIVTPYYNKPTQEGLFQHYAAISAATSLPIVLYNVPGRTGVNMTADTTLRIARSCPNVVAIKEASGNLSQIAAIIEQAPAGFDVISGDDALTSDLIGMGAVGVISVVGNAYPRSFGALVRAAQRNDRAEAQRLQQHFLPIYRDLTVDGNPAGVKALMSAQGQIEDVLRLPLVPATAATHGALSDVARTMQDGAF